MILYVYDISAIEFDGVYRKSCMNSHDESLGLWKGRNDKSMLIIPKLYDTKSIIMGLVVW